MPHQVHLTWIYSIPVTGEPDVALTQSRYITQRPFSP